MKFATSRVTLVIFALFYTPEDTVAAAPVAFDGTTVDDLAEDAALATQIEEQAAADESRFHALDKIEKLRQKLLLLEKQDFDQRNLLSAYNISDSTAACEETCVESCFSTNYKSLNHEDSDDTEDWLKQTFASCILPKCQGCVPKMKLGALQDLLPDQLVSHLDSTESLNKMLEHNAGVQASEQHSILSCDFDCAKDFCMGTFKKNLPFEVSLGCTRGFCGCQALDLKKTAYQQFVSEVARRASQGLPEMPNVEVQPQKETLDTVNEPAAQKEQSDVIPAADPSVEQITPTENTQTTPVEPATPEVPAPTIEEKPVEPITPTIIEPTIEETPVEPVTPTEEKVVEPQLQPNMTEETAAFHETLVGGMVHLASDHKEPLMGSTIADTISAQAKTEYKAAEQASEYLLPAIGLTLAIAIFGTALVITQILDNQLDQEDMRKVDAEIELKIQAVQAARQRENAKDGFEAQGSTDSLDRLAAELSQPFMDFYYLVKAKLGLDGKRHLKKIEGDGAESEEDYEEVAGTVVQKEESACVNRGAKNNWSALKTEGEVEYVALEGETSQVIDLEAKTIDAEADSLADSIMGKFDSPRDE